MIEDAVAASGSGHAPLAQTAEIFAAEHAHCHSPGIARTSQRFMLEQSCDSTLVFSCGTQQIIVFLGINGEVVQLLAAACENQLNKLPIGNLV